MREEQIETRDGTINLHYFAPNNEDCNYLDCVIGLLFDGVFRTQLKSIGDASMTIYSNLSG